MSDPEISACPSMAALDARRDATLWSPGLRLMQHRGPQLKGLLLLLLSGLAVLLLIVLGLSWLGSEIPAGLGNDGWARLAPGVAGLALLAVLYLAVCAWLSLGEPTLASLPVAVHAAPEPAPALAHEPDDEPSAPMRADRRPARHLCDAHLALQLSSQQIQSALGEAARRTLTLCGAFDACSKHAEAAGADLDAVQDEARHTQQLMSSLREQLLKLGGHAQALAGAVHYKPELSLRESAAPRADELLQALHAQIVHCHQLSERIGGAERSSQRRADAMRRCIEGLGFQAERGLREGHQVMVLTRQIEASLAEGAQWLEELGAACAAAGS